MTGCFDSAVPGVAFSSTGAHVSMIIENREELVANGNTKGRKLALDIIDYAMESIDAAGLTRNLVSVDGDVLKVGDLTYNLSKMGDIYVLGAGKGVLQIAEALENVLGERIKRGLVIEKRLGDMKRGLERIGSFKTIEVLQGGHPVPDEVALEGAKEIIEIAEGAGVGDLVFFCVQGGCSSLTTLPATGLSLEDIKETTKALLECGADIRAVSLVRTATTLLRQGSLAKHVHPAEIINLVVNDYVWDFPRFSCSSQEQHRDSYYAGWGPCVPVMESDRSRLESVVDILRGYDVWEKIPHSVKDYLTHADLSSHAQTVKDFERMGIKWHTFVLAGPEYGAEAANRVAQEIGVNSIILSSAIEGEAAEVGVVYAAIAKEIAKNGRPLSAPCALIASGEMTVTIVGEHGEGGRNQECVLSAALKLDGSKDVVVASVGTDGTDGPTSIAGGIVDGYTVKRAREKGIDIFENLKKHNSFYVLTELGDGIRFNEPGNNVCDLSLIIVTD
jgi:glycerate 2-kinase